MGKVWDLTQGAVAGAAGTWLMDLVTQTLLEQQQAEVTRHEERVRPRGATSVENLLALLESKTGRHVGPEQRPMALQALHYGLGVGPGALYAVLRRRLPVLGFGNGLLFGALLWALNDEWLNTRLGLAAAPEAYPPEAHLRGLVGHLVLGMTTDTLVEAIPG